MLLKHTGHLTEAPVLSKTFPESKTEAWKMTEWGTQHQGVATDGHHREQCEEMDNFPLLCQIGP